MSFLNQYSDTSNTTKQVPLSECAQTHSQPFTEVNVVQRRRYNKQIPQYQFKTTKSQCTTRQVQEIRVFYQTKLKWIQHVVPVCFEIFLMQFEILFTKSNQLLEANKFLCLVIGKQSIKFVL